MDALRGLLVVSEHSERVCMLYLPWYFGVSITKVSDKDEKYLEESEQSL